MDQIVTLDTLLIGSGKFPEHLFHPTFGVYLIASLVAKIGYITNQIPVNNITTYLNSINPYFINAQFTNLFRAIAPVNCILICLIWYLNFNISKPNFILVNFIFLICFITSSSLVWQSALIKSEQFCILFWLFSIYLLILSKNYQNYKKYILLIFSGLFIGLCLLTKIQAFLLVVVYYLYFLYQYIDENSNKNFKTNIVLLAIPLGVFFILFITALYTNVESTVTGASSYSINIIGFYYFLILLSSLGISIFKNFYKNKFVFLFYLLTLVNIGFLGSFLLHFVMYKDIYTSFIYLIYDFKMVFLRNIDYSYQTQSNIFDYLNVFKVSILSQPILFISSFIAYFILLINTFLINKNLNKLIILTLIFIIILINIIFINRNWGSDIIWVETSLYFLLFLFIINIQILEKKYINNLINIALFILLSLIIIENISLSKLMMQNLNTSISQYGWNLKSSLSAVYGGNQPEMIKQYEKLLTDNEKNIATSIAEKYRDFLLISNFTFPNRVIQATDMSFLSPDFSIWKNDKNFRFTLVPFNLQNNLAIDPTDSFMNKDYLWSKSGIIDVFINGDKQARVIKKSLPNELPVLIRRDLQVFLYSKEDFELNPNISKCNYRIDVNSQPYNCYEILNSMILNLTNHKKSIFFVIVRKNNL